MRASLLFILIISFSSLSAQTISTEAWQQDLKFLQNTVHEDYPFLFKKITKEAFDTEVDKLYDEIPELEQHEVIVGLARIVSLFKYGHTQMRVSAWMKRNQFWFHQLPMHFHHFSDGVFIQGIHKDYSDALGAKVLAIEGIPIEHVLDSIKAVIPVENEQFFKAYGVFYLGTAEILHAQGVTSTLQDEISITLQKEGKTVEQKFKTRQLEKFPGRYTYVEETGDWLDMRDNSTTPLYLKNLDRIYFFEYLPEHKLVYVRHSQIQDDPKEDIPSFYTRLFEFVEEHDVDRLVLDVRLNGGGNNYKNKAIVTRIIRSEKINKPGSLFVIIGRNTFSACQNLVNELDNYTEAIFVGEPTAENINFYGDSREHLLPNSGIPVYLSYAWWQDKPQWENDSWTAPHINAEMSSLQYATNQDPALDAVINFSSDNFILDPLSYLSDLYQSGDMEKLASESQRIINDPTYRFFDFEGEFNRLGYDLLGSGDLNTAIAVFQFVSMYFPDSANAWDSLAEGCWRAGELEKAKEYYAKAIKMDPDGPVGENARNMLEKMK